MLKQNNKGKNNTNNNNNQLYSLCKSKSKNKSCSISSNKYIKSKSHRKLFDEIVKNYVAVINNNLKKENKPNRY